MEKARNLFKQKIAVTVIIVLICILGAVGVITYAKYMYQRNRQGVVQATEFYFTSDWLDDTGKATYTLTPGIATFTFELGNNADKLRYSNVDIYYTVKLDNEQYSTGILGKDAINTSTVEIDNLSNGIHEIEVIGSSKEDSKGYYKTLKAEVIVQPDSNSLNKELDTSNDEYVLLTVWSEGCKGTVKISYPSYVIPDNTNSVMRDALQGENQGITDEISFSSESYSSHVYRFFVSGDEKDKLTVDDFQVSIE